MRRLVTSATIFMGAAFAGPLLAWATSYTIHGLRIGDLLEWLKLLIWPTVILAVSQPDGVPTVLMVISIGANVFLFGLLGIAVGVALKWPLVLFGLYFVVAMLIGLFASWLSGFDLHHFGFFAFAIALGFYAFLFWLSDRLAIPRMRS
jgi:hypothetical protein